MDWTRYDAALFDLDGVLTPTADVHMRAWERMFSDYLDGRGDSSPYVESDYFDYIDGKPRYDGVRAFLASRDITLPEGTPEDGPDAETVCGLGNRKNLAFNEVLARAKIEPIGEIEPIRWTVPDKIDMILEMTSATARIRFSKLFNPDSPRGEVIVTFLALLELLRLRQITILQESAFTEIEIAKIGPAEADRLPPPVIGGKDHAEPL